MKSDESSQASHQMELKTTVGKQGKTGGQEETQMSSGNLLTLIEVTRLATLKVFVVSQIDQTQDFLSTGRDQH